MRNHATPIVCGLVAVLLAGCPKVPPEPALLDAAPSPTGTVAAREGPSPRPSGGPFQHWGPEVSAHDAAADLIMPDGGTFHAPLGWDLDPADPARDYVRRYVLATVRYKTLFECMQIGKGVADGDKVRVEVREAPSPTCKVGTAVRDVFVVDLARDRLTVDDPVKRAPLAVWPDMSKPDEPAAPVWEVNAVREWASPLAKTFPEAGLAPVHIQGYGRGTYLVVTLAGLRGTPLDRAGPEMKAKAALKKICDTNQNASFAIGEVLDPRMWLRVRCEPVSYKWEPSPAYVRGG